MNEELKISPEVSAMIQREIFELEFKYANENIALCKQLEGAEDVIKALLKVLPDSYHPNNETWSWCWDELNEAACEEIKIARIWAHDILAEIECCKQEVKEK